MTTLCLCLCMCIDCCDAACCAAVLISTLTFLLAHFMNFYTVKNFHKARVSTAKQQLVSSFGLESEDSECLNDLEDRCVQAFSKLGDEERRIFLKESGWEICSRHIKVGMFTTIRRSEVKVNMVSAQLESGILAWLDPPAAVPATVPAAAPANPHAPNFVCKNHECPYNTKTFQSNQALKNHMPKCRYR
jgi:hypothetical protein